MAKPKSPKKKVHLVFQSHPGGEPYLRKKPGEGGKVHISEKAAGWSHGKTVRKEARPRKTA